VRLLGRPGPSPIAGSTGAAKAEPGPRGSSCCFSLRIDSEPAVSQQNRAWYARNVLYDHPLRPRQQFYWLEGRLVLVMLKDIDATVRAMRPGGGLEQLGKPRRS